MRSLVLLFFLATWFNSHSQSKNILTKAFANENAKGLSSFFNETIDLELPGVKGIYSKQQAKLVVNSFFNKHQITKFEENHIGGGKAKANFHIGTVYTSEKKYRSYMLYHFVEDKPQIIELRIEPEE